MIDIVDIKKAVKDGKIFFYVKEGFSKEGLVNYIYCKNDCGECVKVGEVEDQVAHSCIFKHELATTS